MFSWFRRASPAPTAAPPVVAVRGPCDLACAWCNHGGEVHVPTGDENKRVGLELERMAGQGSREVMFGVTHTEPTTHPDFPEIVRKASKLGFGRISLATSGVELASADRVRELKKNGLTDVVVTLAGLEPDVGDVLLGRRGATEVKLETIRNALDADLAVVVEFALLRPVLRTLPKDVRVLTLRHNRAKRLQVGALLLDVVDAAAKDRFELLWPRYGEVAWVVQRLRSEDASVVVGGRRVPVCVAKRLGINTNAPPLPTDTSAMLKTATACAACPDSSACVGIDRLYWECHGEPLFPAHGVLEPPHYEAIDLANRLSREGDAPWPGAANPLAWQAHVLDILCAHLRGATPLAGFFLDECSHLAERCLFLWASADERMEVVVELRAEAKRYFLAGERYCVSYRSATPPDSATCRALLQAVLDRIEHQP